MKKLTVLLLIAALLLALAACGGKDEDAEATPEPEITEDPSADLAASASDAATNAQTHVPPASSTDTELDEELLAMAQSCVGKTTEELYELIGRPLEEPVYTPSTVEEGAEDGMLLYEGFYVWTIRTEEGETVYQADIREETDEVIPEDEVVPEGEEAAA